MRSARRGGRPLLNECLRYSDGVGCTPLPIIQLLFLSAALLACPAAIFGGAKHSEKPLRPSAELAKTLDQITPVTLEGDLSFLASDALAGRDTPSPGLEVAAEFIASRFRAAGLEPAMDGSYFQTADLTREAEESAKRYHIKIPGGPMVGKNVIGILRGSDAALRDTYIIISAHYDHIGTIATAVGRAPKKAPEGSTDKIYNGANDDGSGTVSVIALAEAFSKLRQKPKRSIIFIAFCGEEFGLLGSKYYAGHPVVPLNQTMANINLEQIGRTDGDIKKGSASLTGFEYTSLGKLFQRAGETFGIRVYRDEQADKYFRQSDNLSFAVHGIPDTTLCTSFEFPDYHGLKDEWQKIDYPTLAAIDRIVGTVVEAIANSKIRPQWDPNIPAAEKYRKAAQALYAADGVAASK